MSHKTLMSRPGRLLFTTSIKSPRLGSDLCDLFKSTEYTISSIQKYFFSLHYISVQEKHCTWNVTLSSNETPTWCNTVQVLFLQGHSTCFGRKRPSSGVFKTSTAASGTCVIVSGQSSHLLIRAGGPNKEMWWLTWNYNTCTRGRCTSFKYSWWWALAPETCRVTLQK